MSEGRMSWGWLLLSSLAFSWGHGGVQDAVLDGPLQLFLCSVSLGLALTSRIKTSFSDILNWRYTKIDHCLSTDNRF